MLPSVDAQRGRSYVMHGIIASGGTAAVHIGRLLGPGGFARRVAIKRLHPHLAVEPEVAAMFAEEARLSARVAHANVAAMLDVVSADGELLLVMDYVHGESLSRVLKASRSAGASVPLPIVVSVLVDVLHGLHAAHEATDEDGQPLRLIHRDVSPQNVIVGADGVVRVVDFGIAKAIGSALVTRDGELRGKLPYMAPEQLMRRSIDRKVDIYAAGAVLWEALAGRRLFAANEEAALFGAILESVVPPPSESNAAVSPELDALTLRALARDPGARFATAREMALALEALVPRASPSTIGAWVATTAHGALATREALISEMEREARASSPPPDTRAIRAPTASVFVHDAASRGTPNPAVVMSVPEDARVEPSPARSRRRARAAAAFAAGLLVLLPLFLALRRTPPAEGAPAAASPSAPSAAITPSSSGSAEPSPSANAALAPAEESAPHPARSAARTGTPPAGGASPAKDARSARAAVTPKPPLQWCKVLDPQKGVFVMKEMRVARCP